jgi:adenosylcobyric acid synthase
MGLARARDLPVIVVGDIDRGGVFAALYGTLALLASADQALISGFVVNKFRGDRSLLTPGLDELTVRTGRPVLGVVPFLNRTWIDAEDAVAAEGSYRPADTGESGSSLRVAVIRLPRISNFTDVDALALEPGVCVRFVSSVAELDDADLVILPGTKATVADLAWVRARGLDDALAKRAADGRPIIGICGGYQMLGTVIDDEVESRAGSVPGLGLLPTATRFAPAKTLRRPSGYAGPVPVAGYEIHHGVVEVSGGRPWFTSRPSGEEATALDGCQAGAVSGTLWHGIFENDTFRRSYLAETARLAGSDFVPAAGTCFAAARQAQVNALADAIESSLDTGALLRLIEHGPPHRLPVLRTGI